MLQVQKGSRRKAIAKENYTALSQVIYHGMMYDGKDINSTGRLRSPLREPLNILRYCDDALAEGCIDETAAAAIDSQLSGTWSNRSVVVMHNGSVIFYGTHTDGIATLVVMLFGSKGKNILNEDLLRFRANLNMDGTVVADMRPGLVTCPNAASASCQWYRDLFK